MVRKGVVIHKQKFSTHGAPKKTYMLFQNDIPIDVACHRYTLNMQVSSGTKNNSSANEPSCILALSILKSGENQTKPGLVGKHHTRPLLWCPQCMLSTPG
ncbi:uncharacterized protein TNCV_2534391 [Trichonephila clavipes]|nr:uncharacterized protein TNCV_2534391 [Trichonephila clavipes]